ncbi:MAG: ATP-binding cassette domain-containing protein, partial [Verrucomicrobiota bacterium]
ARNLLLESQASLFRLRTKKVVHLLQNAGEHFHPRLTIAQHFGLGRKGVGGKAEETDHLMRYLYLVGVVDPDSFLFDEVYAAELDGMTRQKLMIASALAKEPAVLIADEPTTALDHVSAEQLVHALETLKNQHGLAVLLATGRVRRAEHFGDEVAVLADGTIVESGPPRILFERATEKATQEFAKGTLLSGQGRERLLAPPKRVGDR